MEEGHIISEYRMVELLMKIAQTKKDIANALMRKARLLDEGVYVDAMIVEDEDEKIPSRILERIMDLKIVGKLKKDHLRKE